MTDQADLPEDVVAAIHAGRKIEAIKLLRGHRGIDLKEAKGAVDDYLRDHPELRTHDIVSSSSGLGRLVVLAIVIAVLYFLYRYLAAAS